MSAKTTHCIGRIELRIRFDEDGKAVDWEVVAETNGRQSTGAIELLSKASEGARAAIDREWQPLPASPEVEG